MATMTRREDAVGKRRGKRVSSLESFHAVIPAGGAGTRLWPLSRAPRPKFLLDLTGSGRSLLQETWDRLLQVGPGRPHPRRQRAHARAARPGAAARAHRPLRRAVAARQHGCHRPGRGRHRPARTPARSSAPSPPTRTIADVAAFVAAVREGVAVAESGLIATLGITPREPVDGVRLHRGRRARSTSPTRPRPAPSPSSSRSRTRRPPESTCAAARSAGTPACSWPAPTCCSGILRGSSPTCTPASTASARPGTPRTVRPSSRPRGRA